MKFIYFFLLLFTWSSPLLSGQEILSDTKVDWEIGALVINITCKLNYDMYPFPKARLQAERFIEERMPSLFVDSILGLVVDSYHTIRDMIAEDKKFFRALSSLSLKGRKTNTFVTKDFKYLKTTYIYNLYSDTGLISSLVYHSRSTPVPQVLGFHATRRFSGIVIYAKGQYPAHGKDNEYNFTPAFFPRIFDENMNIVFNKYMCDPDMLKKWGMATYIYSADIAKFIERIGITPLQISAFGVYGKNNTDIIISNESAAKLLSLEENRQLLKEGRIIIIIDKE